MSFRIEGNNGNLLDINTRGFARIMGAALSGQALVALLDNRTWTVSDTITPTGAGDEFFYLQNPPTNNHNVIISRLQFNAASAETVTLARVTGTAAGGSDVAPVNRTIGNGTGPGITVQTAVDITGLTTGDFLEIWEGTTGAVIDLTNRPIIVPPGEAIALTATTGAIAIDFAVDFYRQLIEPSEL